jgi:hypothetical protein
MKIIRVLGFPKFQIVINNNNILVNREILIIILTKIINVILKFWHNRK